jgi:hypothetical protein
MRCGECGSKNLALTNIKGSYVPWKDYTQVELLFDQKVNVCGECGNHIYTSKDLVELDVNIARSVQSKVATSLQYFFDRGLQQDSLADALGVTPEFLSTVKKGKKRLSFTTFNLLQSYRKFPVLITQLTGIKIPAPREIKMVVAFGEIGNWHMDSAPAVHKEEKFGSIEVSGISEEVTSNYKFTHH